MKIKKVAKKLFIIIIMCSMILGCVGMKKYEWFASGNAPVLYPTELYSGDFILSNKKRLYIPKSIPYASKWGQTGKTHILGNNKFPVPAAIDIIWYSWVENKFYSLKRKWNYNRNCMVASRRNYCGNERFCAYSGIYTK